MKSSSNRGKTQKELADLAHAPGEADASESDWFGMARIRQLVRMMRDNDLSEIDLQLNRSRIRLRRGLLEVASAPRPSPTPPAGSHEAPATVEAATRPDSSKWVEIKSPIVGTFYAASGPDVEPFVRVGSTVAADTIVCIVEAMKVFNEIPAGVGGVVREILVENGAPVDYGQPLFRVEPV
jgi:acetyl-CoA carboxylase biotin carboxyl carrier protein